MYRLPLICLLLFAFTGKKKGDSSWIRINQLGYLTNGIKVAVWGCKDQTTINIWQLIETKTGKIVASGNTGNPFGNYGPFQQTYRLNFSFFQQPGRYYLQAGNARSPEFEIGDNVYKGAADFCLRYMRQQRTGYNPFLKDSCHTHDGYVLYGENPITGGTGIKDSTHIDVVGGWHDASDYLQYVTTSANATYHLLAAYRDFPEVFTDEKLANGLDGKNGIADVLDEAKWGLDWLTKMHPRPDWMFNQIADDRDHQGMRLPKEDSFYGKGFERPVYFVSGEPQQRGKFLNNTKGTSSTAGKFSSAFALGSILFQESNKTYSQQLRVKAATAYSFAKKKLGVTQTASVRSPYIYAEDNWTDDMELAAADLQLLNKDKKGFVAEAFAFAKQEPVTPWLGKDTANHYQWYPFINVGHYELAKQLKGNGRDTIINYYKEGIEKVWNKAKQNAFYRGIPFIWCSNNLTTSFAIQCYWYRQLSRDDSFSELEQANFDWLFGCNPWGTSFVYGLPSNGDTPADPHSAFTHLKNYPIDGGLVDGPVYTSIYNNLIGISLHEPDEYSEFQSNLAVYHDDYGDYSSNEPTMDGTASLIYLLASKEAPPLSPKGKDMKSSIKNFSSFKGAIVRGDSTKKEIALVFTGDEFGDGGAFISKALKKENVNASFFLTGNFYRNPEFKKTIQELKKNNNYLSTHSDRHLLYCDWTNRDSLLVSKEEFATDLYNAFTEMKKFGINEAGSPYFLPPYEWYNDSISSWTKELGHQLINFTPGTMSNADYTTPEMKNYRASKDIYNSILSYEQNNPSGLNGFILLVHIGTDPKRTDKFYFKLPGLLKYLKSKGYRFTRVDEMLKIR